MLQIKALDSDHWVAARLPLT
ncbi:hypothetical protein MTBLM1_80014 [Rhodospirillaceae bacterium LM-1]|nr:hypothetical protein MTBLM1_80014 [Rhodospirillaceae bacterium LM-1]